MPVWMENRGGPLPADAVSCLTAEVASKPGAGASYGPFIVASSTRISFFTARGSSGSGSPGWEEESGC